MDSLDKLLTTLLIMTAGYELFLDVGIFLSWKKNTDKKVVTADLMSIIFLLIMTVGVTASFIMNSTPLPMFIAYIAAAIFVLPHLLSIFTPKGLIAPVFKEGGILPAKEYSYEFVQGKVIKEKLVIHKKGSDRPKSLQIGIKKPELITMLNDNYKKYGVKNPLIER